MLDFEKLSSDTGLINEKDKIQTLNVRQHEFTSLDCTQVSSSIRVI